MIWEPNAPDRDIHASWWNLTQYLDMHVPDWNKPLPHTSLHQYHRVMSNHMDDLLITFNGKVKQFDSFQIMFEFDSQADLANFLLTWS